MNENHEELKENYEDLKIEVIRFDGEDIVRTSDFDDPNIGSWI